MLTCKRVQKEIKAKFDLDVELVKGDGYYYFWGDCVQYAKTTSVMVNRLNQLTLEQWIKEFRGFYQESMDRRIELKTTRFPNK